MEGTYFELEVKPFEFVIHVSVAKDMKSAINLANKKAKHKKKDRIIYEKSDKTCSGIFHIDSKGYHHIFLRYNSDIHDLVHESFHAVMRVARDKGAKWSFSSDEFYAYSLGSFTQSLMDKFYDIKEVKKIYKK